jgi:hypothetical protein
MRFSLANVSLFNATCTGERPVGFGVHASFFPFGQQRLGPVALSPSAAIYLFFSFLGIFKVTVRSGHFKRCQIARLMRSL